MSKESLSAPTENRLESAKKALLTPLEQAKHPASHINTPTYTYSFENEGKKFVYVGCKHINDPTSPVFAEIKEQFSALKPQIVFVEGMEWMAAKPERALGIVQHIPTEEAAKKKYDRLMVAFGRSHAIALEPAIRTLVEGS